MRKPQNQQIQKSDNLTPKQGELKVLKAKFVEALAKHGGVVSKASQLSGLRRETAYDHFRSDPQFAKDWLDALDASHDELIIAARNRALIGTQVKTTDKDGNVTKSYKKSDTMLIFLIRHHDSQKKWRGRLVQTGQVALNTIQERGQTLGLTQAQIEDLQLAVTEQLTAIAFD